MEIEVAVEEDYEIPLADGNVLVESVNMAKKHSKPNPQAGKQGGIIEKDGILIDAKSGTTFPQKVNFVVDVHAGKTPLTDTARHHQSYENESEGAI